jgi:hypothetical protein
LPTNYKLKELYLGGNFIDKKGIAALCDVLKQNNTLQKLSLRDSDLPKVVSAKEIYPKCELKNYIHFGKFQDFLKLFFYCIKKLFIPLL